MTTKNTEQPKSKLPENEAAERGPFKTAGADPFERRDPEEAAPALESLVHVIRKGVRCDTERRGHTTPRGKSRERIVLEATEGFIPLWVKNTILRWRFRESSLLSFANPAAARAAFDRLLAEAILAWGDAAPIRFAEQRDAWDFEIVVRNADDCDINGCVLASAFFPDAGRHQLVLYPQMFTQDRKEQVETLVHEIGHIFGLRHFFAQVSETTWPSVIFGEHKKFSIMNYGKDSVLTDADKNDLKKLYQLAWAGKLTEINGTPIRFVKPFYTGRFESA